MRVGGIEVEISHPDKELFPGDGVTKIELAEYYERISETMLPYLEGRPISMERYPDGIEADGFYQKKLQDYFPGFVHRVTVSLKDGGSQEQAACNNAATLVYLADQGCITPHVWLSREGSLDRPDRLVFDLDPPGSDFGPVREAARALRELLDVIELSSFPMLTGSRGLHLVVPLDGAAGFDTARELGQMVAARLAEERPGEITDEIRKNKREGRVFVDVARNAYGQTAVPPYAVRARKGVPVAVPVEWEELSEMDRSDRYGIGNLFRRLGRKEDAWRGMGRRACSAASALERIQSIQSSQSSQSSQSRQNVEEE
jgi:bifunctional non-homologous end joining protein LigD